MKKSNYIKFLLDFIMGIVFAMLFNLNVLGGLKFHEIAGLSIGAAVLIHLILNIKWIKNITKSIFNKKLALRTRIIYILNLLLLIDMAVIVISGISISKIVFPGLISQNGIFNQKTHIGSAYLGLALIGIHVGLHWKWVIAVFKKILGMDNSKKVFAYIGKALAILILIFGLYSMVTANYLSKTAQIFSIGSSQGMGHNGGYENKGMNSQQNEANKGSFQKNSNNNVSGNYHHNEGGENGNNVEVFFQYISMMGAFAVIVYYLDSFLKIKVKK